MADIALTHRTGQAIVVASLLYWSACLECPGGYTWLGSVLFRYCRVKGSCPTQHEAMTISFLLKRPRISQMPGVSLFFGTVPAPYN